MLTAKDFDPNHYFGDSTTPPNSISSSSGLGVSASSGSSSSSGGTHNKPPETLSLKLKADRQETEEFYLGVSNCYKKILFEYQNYYTNNLT
jgi:hypothetical protein